jgi:EAL domain-containing protein (putative c-di-GMP-specific phosphodiesterase class I)/ActR/RegA family two-component response regulator
MTNPELPRLLVLDDEPAFGQIMARIARRNGWAAETTTDVVEFQRLFARLRPDAIMLDLQLGNADGVEQLRFLQSQHYDGAIVLMSGYTDRVLHAARELGQSLGLAVDAILAKPATNEQIKALLDGFKDFRAPPPRAAATGTREPSEQQEPLSPARIDRGLASGELALEYQPIVNSTTRRVRMLEALARWHHPTRGTIMPDVFIPITEQEPGVIDRLTQWVVRSAGAQAKRLHQQGLTTPVAVNISAKNLRQLDFPDQLVDLVAGQGSSPAAITLEITESAAAAGAHTVTRDILTRLRLKGFRLAMDDFGTGFSSLKALVDSPFSELKIDKSFVADVMKSRDARVIVKSTIRLAQEMGLGTVAEGVETKSVLDQLVEFGIDDIQGYHISRPMAESRVSAWLMAWQSSDARLPEPGAAMASRPETR